MESFKIGAIALLAVIAIMILKQHRPEWSSLIRIAAAVVLFSVIGVMLYQVIEYMHELGDNTLSDKSMQILLKALCIAILTNICSSLCKDCGEGGVASFVEMAGKVEILLLSFPLIREILDAASSLLNLNG